MYKLFFIRKLNCRHPLRDENVPLFEICNAFNPLQFVPQNAMCHKGNGSVTVETGGRALPRIQDKELQEMSDEGMCMSMHQPWASLLVAGIKM